MHIIIDVLLIVIIAFCAWRGFKNGIILGICGILALVISITGANIVAKSYSSVFVDAMQPFVSGIVDGTVSKVINPEPTDVLKYPLSAAEKRDTFYVSYSAMKELRLADKTAEAIAQDTYEHSEAVNQKMNNNITLALSKSLAFMLTFIICFAILAIVFAVLGSLISIKFNIPQIGKVDWIAGIVLGLIRGIMIVLVLVMAFRVLNMFVPENIIGKTWIFRNLMENNLIANILKI